MRVSPNTSGLRATFSDRGEATTRVPLPHVALSGTEAPYPTEQDPFCVRWRGSLTVLEGGTYHFRAPGALLFMGGRVVNEEFNEEGVDSGVEKGIELAAGRHPLDLELVRHGQPLTFSLQWSSEHFAWEPVPAAALSYEPDADVLAGLQFERGLALLEELACIACHTLPIDGLVTRRGPDLTRLAERIRPAWLDRWLAAPHSFRSAAVMPGMLDSDERRQVVGFLASLGNVPPAAPPPTAHDVSRGAELYESVGCAPCHGQPGLELDGLGSKYFPRALAAYLEDPSVTDPGGRMPSLLLTPEEAMQLAAHLGQSRRTEFEGPVPEATPEDLARGRKLIETRGCLACHTLRSEPPLQPRHRVAPLRGPRAGDGCLAAHPAPGLPRYQITDVDRDALRGVLATLRRFGQLHAAPLLATRRRLEALRCNACHITDGADAVSPPPERIPTLRGVGAKLKPAWLESVLLEKRRVRTALRTRMPHYPAAVVKPLARGLTALSGVSAEAIDPVAKASDASLKMQRESGLRHLGTQAENGGLSCISCHDFGAQKPIADEKGPQLLDTYERLRYDWFRRWMLAPGRLASGTSMPTYFTQTPADEAAKTIDALWAALSLGDRLPPPPGLEALHHPLTREVLPVAVDEAFVLRFPLSGTSAAAINVALPRQGTVPEMSFTFDAATCHLALLWQGGFLDLSESLTKRMQPPRLVGEVFFRGTHPSLRFGDVDSVPTSRFRGYRMVDGYPEFRYELAGVEVRERILPLPGHSGITREFHLTSVNGPAWYVEPAEGVALESTVGAFQNGRLKLPEGTTVRFDIRMTRKGTSQ